MRNNNKDKNKDQDQDKYKDQDEDKDDQATVDETVAVMSWTISSRPIVIPSAGFRSDAGSPSSDVLRGRRPRDVVGRPSGV